jgi:hypothetical protein
MPDDRPRPEPLAAAIRLLIQEPSYPDVGRLKETNTIARAQAFATLDVADAIREQTAVYVEQQNVPDPEELLGDLGPALDLARRVAAVQAAEGRNTAASTVNALLLALDMLLGEVE